MVGLLWNDLENSTVGLEDGDAAFNSTAATSTVWKNLVQKQSVPAHVTAAVGLAIMCVGAFTNSGVLAILVRARRQFLSRKIMTGKNVMKMTNVVTTGTHNLNPIAPLSLQQPRSEQ